MVRPVEFPAAMENLVRVIEDTAPGAIVAATRAQLARGTKPATLYVASALAVCRSSEIQIDHHGGPLHPIAGLHALIDAGRRAGEHEFAAVQATALANRHIHAPEGGPYAMAHIEPDPALADGAALLGAMDRFVPNVAEKHLVALLAAGKRADAIFALNEIALRRQPIDDHYPLYVGLTMRTLDAIGWEWAPVVLRPVARWLAMCPISVMRSDTESAYFRNKLEIYTRIPDLEALVERALARKPRLATGPDEDAEIARLAENLAVLTDYDAIPEPLTQAIEAGLSLSGAGEALGIAGATFHVRSNYGNPLDTHIQNGIAVRRYLIGHAEVDLRHKVLGLLSWHTGPECRTAMGKMVHGAAPASEFADLPQEPKALLAEVERAIAARKADRQAAKTGRGRDAMRTVPSDRRALGAADAYLARGGKDGALIATLARLVLRDDATELHSASGFHDAVEMYEATRGNARARHLLSAAKIVLLGYDHGHDIWRANAGPLAA